MIGSAIIIFRSEHMPPYFFRTVPEDAERILALSPTDSARIYKISEATEWMKGAMNDTGINKPDETVLDFLANEVIEARFTGGTLMHVDAESRVALQSLAIDAEVIIEPLN